MNDLMREQYPNFEYYQALRTQLMEMLDDEDLIFNVGGGNAPLGILCVEIGETQISYIESFKTFRQDFSYRKEESGLAHSVTRLSAWYRELDEELKSVLEDLSNDDLRNRLVDRGAGFKLPIHIQLLVYQEALLIFYGKVSVYLKALGKEQTQQWQEWIA